MCAGAEGQVSIDFNGDVGSLCIVWQVASVVNDQRAVGGTDCDGLKALLLPLFVPVTVFGLRYRVGNDDAGEGKVGNDTV